jgi:hypothetical protein
MKRRANLTREQAEGLAIQALAFIAGDSERLGRFLAVTGIGPAEIRTAAREPGFLVGVARCSAVALGNVRCHEFLSGLPRRYR